jgi:lipopolysaccharide export system protein LptC
VLRGAANRIYPLALMLALALLTYWLDRTVREERMQPSQRRHFPDFIVNSFAITNYNRDGGVESTLTAKQMLHYPDDDSTELESPRIVQTKPDEPRMTLTADRGALSQDGADVFLYGNVLLVRDPKEPHPEQRVTTTFLHLVRGRSLVRTDREVAIFEPERQLTARGMEYDNETRQFFLRENVRGRFEPKKKSP